VNDKITLPGGPTISTTQDVMASLQQPAGTPAEAELDLREGEIAFAQSATERDRS
jgi:hypothetical protein